jgi:hypothetical protein
MEAVVATVLLSMERESKIGIKMSHKSSAAALPTISVL